MRRLLDAGMRVFADRGFHAARVDDIVRAARASHGTFYLYFSSKEDLLRALAVQCSEQIEALAKVLGTDPDGISARIADLGGQRGLGELGADRAKLDEVLDVAMARPELSHMTPGEVERADLAAILEAAW